MTFPTFTTGEVLTAADMNAVGLWLVKTQTIGTTVATITVNDAFSSTYDNYKIVCEIPASSTALNLRFTIGTATSQYYSVRVLSTRFDGGAGSTTNVNNGTFWDIAAVGVDGGGSFAFDVYAPNLTRDTKLSGHGMYGAITNGGAFFSAAVLNNNNQYTSFEITTSAGTVSGGTIRVYGYRN